MSDTYLAIFGLFATALLLSVILYGAKSGSLTLIIGGGIAVIFGSILAMIVIELGIRSPATREDDFD